MAGDDARAAFSGPALRAALGIVEAGETIAAYVEALTGSGGVVTDIETSFKDVLVHCKEALTGTPHVGRLFAAAGILWRLPIDQDSVLIVQAGGTGGPGTAYVLHGDGGTAKSVPSWLSATLSGIFLPEGFQLESTGDKIVLRANSGSANSGQPCSITMAQDGSLTAIANEGTSAATTIGVDKNGKVSITTPTGQDVNISAGGNVVLAASGGTVQAGGSGHPAPLWDTFLSDLALFITTLSTILTAGTAGSPVKQQIILASQLSTTALAMNASGPTYKSTKATNG